MRKQKIKLGYEVGTGEEVSILPGHTVITGITNLSGKTTALLGLIKRSGLKAIIVKLKIGEKAITEGSLIPPFYKEDFDWEYAAELLESSRKEKLKFERSWIIKYSKGASNLLEFKRNIDNALANDKLRELDKSVLISLQAYLEKILPELQYAPLSKSLEIREGINIMDLERFNEATQMLIIRSVLNEVLENHKGVIVVIPESWKVIPEDLSTPVKRPAESFVRQGATNDNYLAIDSQDITGTSKVILKQVSNWILGKQTELNEIRRSIDQIPLSKKSKPKPEEIANLKRGQFIAITPDFVKKIYSQPVWVDDKTAIKVAKGQIDPDDLEQPVYIAPYQIITPKQESNPKEKNLDHMPTQDTLELKKKFSDLREDFITNKNDVFTKFQQVNDSISKIYSELMNLKNQPKQVINEDEIVMRVIQKMPVPNISNNSSGSSIDKESLVREIISRIPSTGNVVYEVSPPEKIKKDFLEEAKQRTLNEIQSFPDDMKKVLKWIETKSSQVTKLNIYNYGLGFTSQYSGGGSFDKGVNDLVAKGYIRKEKSYLYANIKNKLKIELEPNHANEQEIEQVYNHILMELLK
jgi:hypothetical protein